MYRARRTWWIVFGAAVTAVLLALAWITVTVIRLDDARAAGENDRLALWRMDAWLMPRLARESARSYAEYESYHAIDVAYNDQYMQLAPNQVYVASPLLTFESDVFPLHFQFDAQGTVTSPQVPTGNRRDLAEATCLLPGVVPDRENRMAAFVDAVDLDALRHRVETSVDVPAMTAAATPVPIPWIADAAGQTEVGQTARSLAEQSKRADGAA
ncbi:MAG: hypothetical protein KDA25_11720, partial [Phycisphaerales bacterium]|nr:hypothetical protein [Phycisphaerales bacterium]